MNIELYIGNRLCDIGNPESFGISLKRVFIKPSELSTKDAQKSYDISLPATAINNEIFGYANVEEVQGKFKVYDDARLYIDGILILDGKFRMNQISRNAYSGNLGVPAAKTVKDIFGETKMNEAGEWSIPFKGIESFTDYNTGKYEIEKYGDNSPCIFPYAMYGLLPKTTQSTDTTNQPEPDVWDSSVRIGVEDLPPSMNVLHTLKQIFDSKKYTLTGSAFNDARLNSLYMSYRNDSSYQQEWNWGDMAKMSVDAEWSMMDKSDDKIPKPLGNYERQISKPEDEYGGYYTIDLFNSNRLKINNITDDGTNIIYNNFEETFEDKKKYTRKSLSLIIPKSGYYKVILDCSKFQLNNYLYSNGKPLTDRDLDNEFTTSGPPKNYRGNEFARSRYEIQVLRDFGTGDFNNNNIVGFYDKPQFPQSSINKDKKQHPKYYPTAKGPMVIDPSVNENFICGLHWGEHEDDANPKDEVDRCQYMFIANGFSWNKLFSQRKKILCAYDSSGNNKDGNYWCWGTVDDQIPEEGTGEGTEEGTEEQPVVQPEEQPVDWLEEPVKRRYAILENNTGFKNEIRQQNRIEGDGKVGCIIWLEKGERITVNVAGDLGDIEGNGVDKWIVLINDVKFKLTVEPFRTDISWNKFKNDGSYIPKPKEVTDSEDPNYNKTTDNMSWELEENAPDKFQSGEIDLVKFLPSNMRVDEFVDNFCKAFNLNLSQTDDNVFSLDVKQSRKTQQNMIIDIDSASSVKDKVNESLGLPAVFSIGFTVNSEEEGYVQSGTEQVGGEIYTGSPEDTKTEQKSSFSYNWFKDIKKMENGKVIPISLPVISKAEVWIEADKTYAERMSKVYTDLPIRFWYPDGLMSDTGATFNLGGMGNEKKIELAKVSNTLPDMNTLSYKNEENTILTNYFSLLANAKTDYTTVECYLQPEEYVKIGEGALVRFNGDIYYVAEIDGYDPLNRKKCKLKLIRKTIL